MVDATLNSEDQHVLVQALLDVIHEANNLILIEEAKGGHRGKKIKSIAHTALVQVGYL